MRGQAHTLEGVAAALVVVLAVTFTLQATAVTPLTASTASQHIETQHERAASGLLDTAHESGSISTTLRYWNDSGAEFQGVRSDNGYYVSDTPNTTFGGALADTFGDRAIVYNVNTYYVDQNRNGEDERRLRRLVYNGDPSADAVAVSRFVTLYDDQRMTGSGGTVTLANSSYFTPNAPGPVYAVVEVEVVVWRM
jgi:hypothetical protein